MKQVEKLRETLQSLDNERIDVSRQRSETETYLRSLAQKYASYCKCLRASLESNALTEVARGEIRGALESAERMADFTGVALLVLSEGRRIGIGPRAVHRWLRAAETTTPALLEELVRNEALRALADEQGDDDDEIPF